MAHLLPDADGLHGAGVLKLQKHVLAIKPAALLVWIGLDAPDVPAITTPNSTNDNLASTTSREPLTVLTVRVGLAETMCMNKS